MSRRPASPAVQRLAKSLGALTVRWSMLPSRGSHADYRGCARRSLSSATNPRSPGLLKQATFRGDFRSSPERDRPTHPRAAPWIDVGPPLDADVEPGPTRPLAGCPCLIDLCGEELFDGSSWTITSSFRASPENGNHRLVLCWSRRICTRLSLMTIGARPQELNLSHLPRVLPALCKPLPADWTTRLVCSMVASAWAVRRGRRGSACPGVRDIQPTHERSPPRCFIEWAVGWSCQLWQRLCMVCSSHCTGEPTSSPTS